MWKSAAVGLAVVAFSVLTAHFVETGRESIAQSRVDTRPVVMFATNQAAQAVSPSGSAIRTANTRFELEHYDAVQKQKLLDKAAGRSFPHCIYTVPSGTKCRVQSQVRTSVEVIWEEGPMIQAIAWVDSRDLTGRRP